MWRIIWINIRTGKRAIQIDLYASLKSAFAIANGNRQFHEAFVISRSNQ